MHKFLRRTLLALAGALVLVALYDVATYDAEAWQSDFSRLKADMAQGYANLDWNVEQRKLDIRALDSETTSAIASAHSRVRAFIAIRRFIKSFKDPHFRLTFGDRPIIEAAADTESVATGSAEAEHVDPPAGADCAAAGYGEEAEHAFKFPFSRLPNWTPLRDNDFPTGLAGDVGVLRIAQFGENSYADACREVFRPGMGEYALKLAVRAGLQRKLIEAVHELKAKGAQRLMVDVTGNGGGTEWVSEVIALMTDKPLTRQQARIVDPACDRSGIWRGEKTCPVLETPGERATLQGVGAWTGPVLILADRGTGSASEDFVAWLQQNKVARVIGEGTAGAGCGYVNGGTRTQFRASPFDVMMPNCARFLDNGINEIEGIAPDIEIPMHLDDPRQQADALAAAMAQD